MWLGAGLSTLLMLHPTLAFASPPEPEPESIFTPPRPSVPASPAPSVEGPRPAPPSESTATPAPPDDVDTSTDELSSGIDFAEPGPALDPLPASNPGSDPYSAEDDASSFRLPDPGTAPSDGVGLLVLGGTTVGLTIAGFGVALWYGLDQETPLRQLLPGTLVPTVGLLAFGGGSLYQGIQRANIHRRWAAGHRVRGLPQGAGLKVGASFGVLATLGLLTFGSLAYRNGYRDIGVGMLSASAVAGVATPIMFVLGARNSRRYRETDGWVRRPLPPRPLPIVDLRPSLQLLPGGLSLSVAGRF